MKPEELVQRPGIRVHVPGRTHRMQESARLVAVTTIRKALAACGQPESPTSVTGRSKSDGSGVGE